MLNVLVLVEGVHKKLTFLWLCSFGANFREMIVVLVVLRSSVSVSVSTVSC